MVAHGFEGLRESLSGYLVDSHYGFLEGVQRGIQVLYLGCQKIVTFLEFIMFTEGQKVYLSEFFQPSFRCLKLFSQYVRVGLVHWLKFRQKCVQIDVQFFMCAFFERFSLDNCFAYFQFHLVHLP